MLDYTEWDQDALPPGYLPCARPDLIEGYVSIERVFAGDSVDFGYCSDHETRFCDCNMDEKREDESYRLLVKHFRSGGAVNQPLNYRPYRWGDLGDQGNGHHRLTAAYDAGFTHVPFNSRKWGDDEDWADTPKPEYYS